MAPLNILIVGCSIAGPTLATFLLLSQTTPASQKPHITILERSSALRTQGQNIDVRGSGITIIRKLGLEAAIRASTTGEVGVKLVDKNDRVWAAIAVDKSGRIHSPTSDIEIMRGRMAELLFQRSKQVSDEVQREGGAGIEYVFGDCLDQIVQDGSKVRVRFAKTGHRRTFDLVVGADGLQSRTRTMVWGSHGETDRVKGLNMYAGFFSIPKAETDSMWRRWFHAPGRRGVMLRPDQQRGKTIALMTVINERDDRFKAVAATEHHGADAQKALLEEYFRDAGWESKRVIREMWVTDDFYYDTVGQVKMDRWSKGRVVLLGDAGYCASFLSGMGTTLALNGAYSLAGTLSRHPNDLTAAFAEYEESMRPLVAKAQKLAPGMPRLMNPETAWGVCILHLIACIIDWCKLFALIARFVPVGPSADFVPVEDFGFKDLPEWADQE
ncbi:oxidoreductase [Xylariales sp. AK1849]|nr:oxidoreductase [Xylariales sp. AK1849]